MVRDHLRDFDINRSSCMPKGIGDFELDGIMYFLRPPSEEQTRKCGSACSRRLPQMQRRARLPEIEWPSVRATRSLMAASLMRKEGREGTADAQSAACRELCVRMRAARPVTTPRRETGCPSWQQRRVNVVAWMPAGRPEGGISPGHARGARPEGKEQRWRASDSR